jgi:hypothetical protein
LDKHEFKVGDKVRVARKVETDDPNGMGEGKPWDNAWVSEMSYLIGSVAEVEEIDPALGVILSGSYYLYPLAALELIEQAVAEGV